MKDGVKEGRERLQLDAIEARSPGLWLSLVVAGFVVARGGGARRPRATRPLRARVGGVKSWEWEVWVGRPRGTSMAASDSAVESAVSRKRCGMALVFVVGVYCWSLLLDFCAWSFVVGVSFWGRRTHHDGRERLGRRQGRDPEEVVGRLARLQHLGQQVGRRPLDSEELHQLVNLRGAYRETDTYIPRNMEWWRRGG